MVTLPESIRAALAQAPLAHVVTLNKDGSPQVSVTWVKVEGDDLIIASLGDYQKVKNVRRDPRIAISFETEDVNPIGMKHYLVVHGTATIESGGAPEALQEMAYSYVGPGVKFPPFDNPPPGYLIRVRVDRIGGLGPWTGG